MYQFLQDEQGTAAIEYSLFISLIGLVIAGALHILGANLVHTFSSVSEGFPSVQVIEDNRKSSLFKEF